MRDDEDSIAQRFQGEGMCSKNSKECSLTFCLMPSKTTRCPIGGVEIISTRSPQGPVWPGSSSRRTARTVPVWVLSWDHPGLDLRPPEQIWVAKIFLNGFIKM